MLGKEEDCLCRRAEQSFIMSKKPRFVACVSSRMHSEHIIKAAKCMADEVGASLSVVSVFSPGGADPEMLEHLKHISHSLDAELTILYSEKPVLAVVDYVNHCRATDVVVGQPSRTQSSDFVPLLRAVLPKVKVTVIPPVAVSQQEGAQIVTLLCGGLYQPVGEKAE